MSTIWRGQEPLVTSVQVVGSNVEIRGTGFPAAGSTVLVNLSYQSAYTSLPQSTYTVTKGWVGNPTTQVGGDEFHICQSMSGVSNWDANYGVGMMAVTYPKSITYSYMYYDQSQVCDDFKAYGWRYCPKSNCGKNSNACCGWVPNPSTLTATTKYTQGKTYTGTVAVSADGVVRVPLSALGSVSTNLTMTAAVSKTGAGYSVNLSPGTYYWKVTADNGVYQTDSSTWSFTITSGVAGTVYYDSGNTCSTGSPGTHAAGATVTYQPSANGSSSYSGTVAADGTYTISGAPNGTGTLTLSLPTGYSCSTSCGAGCPTATSVSAPSTGNNFYITDTRNPWWQAVGAGVYAGSSGGGTTIRSNIPSMVNNSTIATLLPSWG